MEESTAWEPSWEPPENATRERGPRTVSVHQHDLGTPESSICLIGNNRVKSKWL